MNSATGQDLFVVGPSRIRVKNVFPFSLSIGNKNSCFFKGPNGDKIISSMLNKVALPA